MPAQDLTATQAALRDHLDDCARARGRWHGLRGGLQLAHAWLRPRLVSTLLLLLLLLAGMLWAA